MHRAEHRKRPGKRRGMRKKRRSRPSVPGHSVCSAFASVFSPSAPKRQTRQRNSQLHTGDYPVQIAQQNLYNFRSRIPVLHQLPHARQTHCDQRKLRRREKSIQRDERQHADQPNSKHT